MRIRIWKGSHSPLVQELIQQTWKNSDLLLLCPPNFEGAFDFISQLPEGSVEFVGEWEKIPEITRTYFADYPETPVFGIFSTGTTGRKLVLYSKKNIESSLRAILSLFNSRAYSAIFCYPQPFHTFGLILGYCHAFLYFKKLIAPEGNYSTQFHSLWANFDDRGLFTLGTPTHFKDLLKYVEENSLVPRKTYSSIIGAAKVEKNLWENSQNTLGIQFPSIGYGATEASPGITHLSPGKAPLEDGEVGQLLSHIENTGFTKEGFEFSGSAVCLAIIQNNTIQFPQSIHIKDILEKREDGVLIYKGRSELVLNRGGEKFALEEIESFLKEKMNIESVCVPIPHPRLGEELGIVAMDAKANKDSIYALLKQRFGRDFDNDLYHNTVKLPINSSSKVDRKECQKILEKTSAASSLHV